MTENTELKKGTMKQMIIILSVFSLILLLSHVYMYARIDYYLQLNNYQHSFVGFVLSVLFITTVISLSLSHIVPRSVHIVLTWIAFPWMGITLLMCIIFFGIDIFWLILQPISNQEFIKNRSIFQYGLGVMALSITLIITSYALWNGMKTVKVHHISINFPKWPKSLNDFKIVQISDLHIGTILTRTWLSKVVQQVNALKPDLVVITGDLVDGAVEELRLDVQPLQNLKALHGVYFITGNHEYYSGVTAWCAHLSELGINVLRNQHVTISAGPYNETFDLAGVDDWSSDHFPGEGADLAKALRGRNLDNPLILLAHQPVAVNEASSFNVDLQLSGHTHAGQIWPFNYLVYLQQPYLKGLHRIANTQLYVSPGTGFWGPPMRLGSKAEISLITIQSAS